MSCCKLKELYIREHVGKCKVDKSYEYKRKQYAAIDSHISYRELPIISASNFCSEEAVANVCIKDDFTLEATILAIVGTYSNVGNLIFFIENDNKFKEVLSIVSNFRLKYSAGITMSIHRSSIQEGYFDITVHENNKRYSVSEDQMLSSVNDFSQRDKSMIFYLYPEAVGYSNAINTSSTSIWVSVLTGVLNMTGMNGSRLLPIFYTQPEDDKFLSINVGAPSINITTNVSQVKPQYETMVSKAISSVSKDGYCYYCAYLDSIHSHLCHEKETEFEAQLLGKFSGLGEN